MPLRLVAPLLLTLLYVSTPPAHAYLDPGNGSMLLQIILGGVAGIGVLLKYYWHQVAGIFKPRKQQVDKEN